LALVYAIAWGFENVCQMKVLRLIMLFLHFILALSSVHAQRLNRNIDSMQQLLQNERQDSSKARLLYLIGDEYRNQVLKYDSALFFYQAALNLARKEKIYISQLAAANRIANAYNFSGRYAEALELSLENLELEERIKDTTQILFTKREIMFVYRNIGDHQKELELAKGLDSFATSGYFKDANKVAWYRLIAYNNIGTAYVKLNQMDSALHYIMKLYREAKENNDFEFLVIASNRLAEIYNKNGKLDSSLYYSRLCIANAAPAHRLDFLRYAHHWLAYAFQKQGQFDSAFFYAHNALGRYKNMSDTSGMLAMAFLLSDLHKSQKQFDSAYSYLSYHTSLKEKVLSEEKIRKVQVLLFNETLRQKQLEQERREAQQRYASRLKSYSLGGGLAVLALIAFFLWRNSQQKQKANKMLHQKNEQIQTTLTELKATQAQLIQSEKMASLGELTAGIAHEIQNPLNFINNFAEVNTELVSELQEELQAGNIAEAHAIAGSIRENEEKITLHGKRADAIVKNMLQHSRTSKGEKQPTDINALADEYLRLSYHGFRAKDKSFNATFITDFDESVAKVQVEPQDIGRVLLNLFNNAFYAVHDRKKKLDHGYKPTVAVSTKKLDKKIEIRVQDNGMGISKSLVDKVFQPFFTTKPTGQGTGLGLSLSYDIIKAHGGEINVETNEGEGSVFTITIPTA
jgi:signal transduction histidine kinase